MNSKRTKWHKALATTLGAAALVVAPMAASFTPATAQAQYYSDYDWYYDEGDLYDEYGWDYDWFDGWEYETPYADYDYEYDWWDGEYRIEQDDWWW